ncbi:MAG: DHH family phosphoesterase [Candidatus Latescibacteria bacterium]|nr:DHH family phosphoesterase [Candidatus Latescibacterota bacterium]
MTVKDSKTEKVKKFLNLVGKRRLWIQTHDIPDPDALASAEAFRVIARHFGITARIVINGFPVRRENNALIKECKIHAHSIDAIKIRSAKRSAWVFVDCLPGGGNVTLHPLAPGDLFLAIDHHGRPDDTWKTNPKAFVVADPDVGATATMLGKLLLNLKIPVSPRLASAITYAIITDTQDFSRGASKDDLEVYGTLFFQTNQKIISRLRNTTKSRSYFQTVYKSLVNTYTYRHVSWVFIGKVDGREFPAEMADFILSCERITWSLALGHTPHRLYISLRSSQPNAQCGQIIQKLVKNYNSTAGGHNQFAGGFILLDVSDNPEIISALLIKRFLRLILRLPKYAEIPMGTSLVSK